MKTLWTKIKRPLSILLCLCMVLGMLPGIPLGVLAVDNEYTITWKIDDDTVLDTTTVIHGQVPVEPVASKEPDGCTTYTFAGWDKPSWLPPRMLPTPLYSRRVSNIPPATL